VRCDSRKPMAVFTTPKCEEYRCQLKCRVEEAVRLPEGFKRKKEKITKGTWDW